MRLPLSQLRRILCEADEGIKGLVDEIVAVIKDQYDGCHVDIDRPESLLNDTYIIDVYHEFERDKKTPPGHDEELRAVVKSAVWLFGSEEPVIRLTSKETVMTTREYRVFVCKWTGGYVQINVEPKLNLSSMSLKENVSEPVDELISELTTHFEAEYGDDNVVSARDWSNMSPNQFVVIYATLHEDLVREAVVSFKTFLESLESALWMTVGEKPKVRHNVDHTEIVVGRFVLDVIPSVSQRIGATENVQRQAFIDVKHYPVVSRNMSEAPEEFDETEEVLEGVYSALFDTATQHGSKVRQLETLRGGPKGFVVHVSDDMPVKELAKKLVSVAKQMFLMLTTDKPKVRKTGFHETFQINVPGYRVNVVIQYAARSEPEGRKDRLVVWTMPHKKPMKESVKSRKAFRLMPEIKTELLGYLGGMFGDDKVSIAYEGAVNLSINVTQVIDDATMQDVSDEVAGLLQMYTGEQAIVDKKINWNNSGHIYVIKSKLFGGYVIGDDKMFNVNVGTDR